MIYRLVAKEIKFVPKPIDVERLMLTSLGAWMDVRGFWDPDVSTRLSVEEWKHRGTMGRDHYVKVVYKGYLFPFGHKASLVKVTERKFHHSTQMILSLNIAVFVKGIELKVGRASILKRSDALTASREIIKFHEKEIKDLVVAIEGRSREEGERIVNETKTRFNKLVFRTFRRFTIGRDNSLNVLTTTIRADFEASIIDVIDKVAPWKYIGGNGNIAYLRQRMYIIVRQPIRYFTKPTGLAEPDPEGNPLVNRQYDLQFPFSQARITTLVTPNLDPPDEDMCQIKNPSNYNHGQQLFWPTVSEKKFGFHIILKDYANNETEFTIPLVFIDQTMLACTIDENEDSDEYIDESDKYTKKVKVRLDEVVNDYIIKVGNTDIQGQSIMYADSADDQGRTYPGKTTLETNSIIFSAEIPDNLKDSEIPPFYPIIHQANVIIPSIKHLAGNDNSIDVRFNAHYLEHGFHSSENTGEVFLDLVNISNLDFNSQGDRSGGLVKPNIGIRGFSKKLGPVGGSKLIELAKGTFDPADFFAQDAKIFGVISLTDIIKKAVIGDFSGMDPETDTDPKKFLKITTDTRDDKLIAKINWKPDLKDWENLFIASNEGEAASLVIDGTMTVQSTGKSDMEMTCTLSNFCLDLIGNIQSFLLIRFKKVEFISRGGKKADVNVDINAIEFIGVLAFVEELNKIIPMDGFSDPPSLEVTASGITAGFSLAIPNITVGVFSLENINLGAAFTIPFRDEPLSMRLNFCDRHEQFLLTVSCFGGGGFFALTLNPGGIQQLEAAFEFGAILSVNFGVASGGVHVMAGIYYEMVVNPEKADLAGYFRMGGNVSVLGIINASIEFYLALHYEFASGKCVGKATLAIEVEIAFFSTTVEISCEKKFAGSDGDPSFAEIMGQYTDPKTDEEVDPWKEYCKAFA